jgi:hypothetical protein
VDSTAAAEADTISRLAIRTALEAMSLAANAFLVVGDEHPPTRFRFEQACRSAVFDVDLPPEDAVAKFVRILEEAALPTAPSLTAAVLAAPTLSFAYSYSQSDLEELDRLDRLEALFHAPLPGLLHLIGNHLLGPRPWDAPHRVLEAARRAEDLNLQDDDTEPLDPSDWIAIAAGRWWLFDSLLAARSEDEIEAALDPPPATRFCDWAPWIEADSPPDLTRPALAALYLYARHGRDIDDGKITASGLDKAVGAWLSVLSLT